MPDVPDIVDYTARRFEDREWYGATVNDEYYLGSGRDSISERRQAVASGQLPEFWLLDRAIATIQVRMRMPEGPGAKRLLEAMASGDILTWKSKHAGIPPDLVDPATLKGARVELASFKVSGAGGIIYQGHRYHLHRFCLSEDDFLFWLANWVPQRTEQLERLSEHTPVERVGSTDPEQIAISPHRAGNPEIDATIVAVYDAAAHKGMKPPNVKEVVDPVIRRLKAKGPIATKVRAQELAEAKHHQKRRRQPGPRVYGSLLPFSDQEM